MSHPTSINAHFIISTSQDGRRFDQVLTELLAIHSRARVQTWIESGQVLLNDRPTVPKQRVREGDKIDVNVVLPIETEAQGENIALDIVYADEDVIVLNKPAGFVVHPGAGVRDGTLMNALLYHYPELAQLPRAGIVHRLDKDTTGLMMVARSLAAHTALVAALQAREVKRRYLAVAQGVMRASGTVDTQMGRHPRNRVKMAVLEQGKHAITHYRMLERFSGYTYVQCDLETGRTHQIRVHMAHIGYPLVGDLLYGANSKGLSFPRQALHATFLSFKHPITQQWVEFQVDLPADMAELIATLRKDFHDTDH